MQREILNRKKGKRNLIYPLRELNPRCLCYESGTKWCCVQTLGTRYIIAQFSARVQGRDSGTGTVPEFWRGYLKKWCIHISAHQESFSGTVLGHQV